MAGQSGALRVLICLQDFLSPGCEFALTRYMQPKSDLKLLSERLKRTLPTQLSLKKLSLPRQPPNSCVLQACGVVP